MSLRAINLNLIPVLRALLQERNVSRAAVSVGLTQSAASAALSRLRSILGDPLLVRVGRGMELTPRARALIEPVEDLCVRLAAIWQDPQFDPGSCRRNFVITTTDYTSITSMAGMIAVLRKQAPGVSIQFLSLPPEVALARKADEIDFLMLTRVGLERAGGGVLQSLPLFHDDFVAVVGPHHRLASGSSVAPTDYLNEPHIVFYPGDFTPRDGVTRTIAARVQQFSVLPFAAALTDCVVIMPRRIFDHARPLMDLRLIYELSPPIKTEVLLTWRPFHDEDPAHQWFRRLLVKTVGTSTAAESMRE